MGPRFDVLSKRGVSLLGTSVGGVELDHGHVSVSQVFGFRSGGFRWWQGWVMGRERQNCVTWGPRDFEEL